MGGTRVSSEMGAAARTGFTREPSRKTPVAGRADVVVCGGGPAGVAAAVAAARGGASVRLLERHGCLGGIWTSGYLSWVLDWTEKPGLLMEIFHRLEERSAGYRVRRQGFITDPESLKLLLEQMAVEARVGVRLHTQIAAAWVDGGRLTHALTESKSGREAWSAAVFIDATGDGDLSTAAGCGYDLGEPGTGQTQPFSLIAVLSGIDPLDAEPYHLSGARQTVHPKLELAAEMQRAGVPPSYTKPCLWHVRDGLYVLMANHEYGYSGLDAGQITEATFRARRELHRLIAGLRSLGGIWRNLRLVATAEQIGVREGRRIAGLYTITQRDLIEGTRHRDAVCRVNFGIDVHSLDPTRGTDHEPVNRTKTLPYDIPLRALIARDVRGLLLAGRCISGDFLAHSSYRVTGDAVQTGQGAGVLAALAARSGIDPREVPWPEIERVLGRTSPTDPEVNP